MMIIIVALQAPVRSQPTGVTTWQAPSVPRVKDTTGDLSPNEAPAEDEGEAGEVEAVVVAEASNMITGEALI